MPKPKRSKLRPMPSKNRRKLPKMLDLPRLLLPKLLPMMTSTRPRRSTRKVKVSNLPPLPPRRRPLKSLKPPRLRLRRERKRPLPQSSGLEPCQRTSSKTEDTPPSR